MSREFVWRPVEPVPPPSGAIGLTLWRALCQWRRADESIQLNGDDLPWLVGFTCGSTNEDARADAFALITAIESNGTIVVEAVPG